jgi:hypothetical protein
MTNRESTKYCQSRKNRGADAGNACNFLKSHWRMFSVFPFFDVIKYSAPRKVRYCIHAAFLSLLIALMMNGVSPAAVMPDYEHLSPVTNIIDAPVAVALDREGRLYVAETSPARVVIFSQSGKYLATLAGLETPVSVAVDDGGRILVGSKEKGRVEVYAPDFTQLFKLGAGDGEFSWPSDICIDTTGRIYVLDRGKDILKIYDSSGHFLETLGGTGNENGQFYRPVAMTIDEAAGEIIVLDRQLISGTPQQGARVQYFTLAGTYLRGFTRNGTQEGGLVTPQGITVDKESRIYVTDSYQNAVLVYDSAGAFGGVIYDLDDPMRVPLGATMDGTNRLYAASRLANRIEIYGIDQYTSMDVDPGKLNFSAREGGANPASQSISVHNSGNTAIDWGAGADQSWLGLSGDNGVLAQGQTAAIDVAVDITGLEPGKYAGTITVSAGPGATEVVQVALTVKPSAFLSISPVHLTFTSQVGTDPALQILSIANLGSAPLQWRLSAAQKWLSVSKTSGTVGVGGPDSSVKVLADVTSLAAGTHTGSLIVTGQEAGGSPSLIDVTLNLVEPGSGPGTDPILPPPLGTTLKGNFGRTWRVAAQTGGTSLNSIWGSSSADIFAVGEKGTILHFDGKSWNEENVSTSSNLNGVWGASASMVYAVGDNGLVLHYDGERWTDDSPVSDILHAVWCGSGAKCLAVGQDTSVLSRTNSGAWISDNSMGRIGSLRGVWAAGESDIYVVGDFGTILHNDGSGWQSVDSGVEATLYDVWGSAADNVYAVGQAGTILRYNGTEWASMASGTTVTLTGIWGNAADDVYAVGEDGTMLLYQGAQWDKLETGFAEQLNDAWGAKKNEIYAVGADGSIIFGKNSFPWLVLRPILLHPQSGFGVEKTDSLQTNGLDFSDCINHMGVGELCDR